MKSADFFKTHQKFHVFSNFWTRFGLKWWLNLTATSLWIVGIGVYASRGPINPFFEDFFGDDKKARVKGVTRFFAMFHIFASLDVFYIYFIFQLLLFITKNSTLRFSAYFFSSLHFSRLPNNRPEWRSST